MERDIMTDLIAWRDSPHRKPLLLEGARQVGKTWCLRQLGTHHFDSMAYIDFEADVSARGLFDGDIDIDRIVAGLGAVTGVPVQADKTLIVLDEIQQAPRAVTALKYFADRAPQYHVAAAGSLLGVALHEDTSFPVGKVDFLTVRPMTFREFADAAGLGGLVAALDRGDWAIIDALHERCVSALRDYLCIGGMPEAVLRFVEQRDYGAAETVKRAILEAYERDFGKHAPSAEVPRIAAVWRSLPSQLAKASGRFVYGEIAAGARGRQYEAAIMWLQQAGLVHVVRRVAVPRLPLSAYEDPAAFKLYGADTGLMMSMSGLDVSAVVDGNRLFTEFKGALAEQFVAQELVAATGRVPGYWTSGPGGAEVDFICQVGNDVVPIEVKAERNLRAKSLQVYRQRYRPPVAVRTSLATHAHGDGLIDLPLYAIGGLKAAVAPGEK